MIYFFQSHVTFYFRFDTNFKTEQKCYHFSEVKRIKKEEIGNL